MTRKETMTKDTKRALEIIKPLADELDITIRADDEYLYMNSQPIRIECNSTYATLMEALGFIYYQFYPWSLRCDRKTIAELKKAITHNWVRRKDHLLHERDMQKL